MVKTKKPIVSLVAMLLCVSMLVGMTFAWFTDSFAANKNIESGKLDVEMYWTKDMSSGVWHNAGNEKDGVPIDEKNWEPGYTIVRYVKIVNAGDLALDYSLKLDSLGTVGKLAEVIGVYYSAGVVSNIADRTLAGMSTLGSLKDAVKGGEAAKGNLAPRAETVVAVALKMDETAGNEYQKADIGDGFIFKLVATQATAENDGFDNTYDEGALPEFEGGELAIDVSGKVKDNVLTEDVVIASKDGSISAHLLKGTKLNSGVSALTLKVTEKSSSDANVTPEDGQQLRPLDVHVEGVAADNTVPVIIGIKNALAKGLNIGNYTLYHVENGETVAMTYVAAADSLSAHNQFSYDPATGDVTLAMATFSEVALVAEEPKWEGKFDYSWYTNAVAPVDGESEADYIIANADQLAGFGAIVGGMNGQKLDTFAGKTVKLVADINLGDKDGESTNIFHPIGYYYTDDKNADGTKGDYYSTVYSFEGTFDGNGHTIANFYQNTWEIKGDYDGNYYKDAMGLFGYVVNGKVMNLTVDNFSSDGEFTPTGVIAAYAVNSTFENIAITKCNPRVYNTGNGGIIGIAGNSGDKDVQITLKNITVDNSNKISALWGSWDVACGGLVGMFRGNADGGNGKIHFENCHVSAQIDVYNDVCANYQYYAYRYSGMIIGSVRHNTTNAEGKTIPNMTGISASGCTVHFGTWNDYYYCELVDNTTASYTHDYQMSRLVEIKAIDGTTITYLDGTTGTIPSSGRANYVIVDYTKGHGTENATCYHFKDGDVWTHDMGGIQTGVDENGDGQDDLREDKQHLYLEFNNLFTGYGWGVSSMGIDKWNGITALDVTTGDHESSVKKFDKAETAKYSYTTEKTVTIGELFKEADIGEKEAGIHGQSVIVTISPVGEGSTAGGKYTAKAEDWTKGTLTFSGTGKATITISDYYFCIPTTIEVEIIEKVATEKFDIVMNNGDFLHRVGNSGTVALDKLFKAKDGVSVGTVSVTVEAVNGTGASGTYTSNATWTNGTIQFSGTGVVKVTIKDDDKYCTATVLHLEVVDAVNATSATDAKTNNVVLLNDCSVSSFNVSNGYSFYGNGFKVTFTGDGSYRSAAVSYGFVTVDKGGVLDNVQIICNIFPESYMYTTEMKAGSDGRYPYGYSAVVIAGNSTISNCYIYGARNNIQVGEGNVTIENTVLECGSLSNIHIKSNTSYTVTLDNITTIQYLTESNYDTSKTVMGFGVLVGTNESESNPKIILKGDLKQYNWVNSNHASSISNTYAKTAISEALKVDTYQHTIDGKNTVNMGIAYLNNKEATITDNRENKDKIPYELSALSMVTYTGQVFSIISDSGITAESRYDATTDGIIPYKPTANRPIMPVVNYGETNEAIGVNTEFDDVQWIFKFSADLDKISGGSYTFKFADLTVEKYGVALGFTIKDEAGKEVDKNVEIPLTELTTKDYTLAVTDNEIYDNAGNVSGKTATYEIPFVINATKTSIEPPKFTNTGTGTGIKLVDKKGGDWRPAYTVLTGVTVTYWSASESKVKTVDLSTIYNKGTISSNVWTYTCDDYTLTITGGQVHSDGTKITPIVSNNTLYFASTNKAFGTGTASRNIILTYVFTDKNASTTWNRTETVTHSGMTEYSYSSFKNGKLEAPSSGGGGCVTPDTLITLADGSQVRIDSLKGDEMLLVWNHETGKIDKAPVAYIVDHEGVISECEIIHLNFANGKTVKIIGEHVFFDATLNKYISIDTNNVDSLIGHMFTAISADGSGVEQVELVSVRREIAVTAIYEVVTYKHITCFTEGMLSASAYLDPLLNVFDIDVDTMAYNAESVMKDIETYGLYTYADFEGLISEEAFELYNAQYLKIAVGKGYITWQDILALIDIYFAVDVQPIK